MSKNEDFYDKFNTNSTKKHSFKSNVFIPFVSGILGASLVMGLSFGVPDIRKKLIPDNFTESINSNSTESNNTRNC